MEKINIPLELKNAICNDQLVLFVGAGLSHDLLNINKQKLKGWGNLVEQVLVNLKDKGYGVDPLLALVDRYEAIKILDLIESDKTIPKSNIYDFTKDFLDLDEENNDFELHKKLFRLSNKIVTTNYDSAFEKAVPELRKNKAYKGKNYEFTTHKHSASPLLFKLHGCFEDANSMVLFPSNYRDLYQNTNRDAEHSILVLKNIIINKSVLFIGTGMGDFQINNLFAEVKKLQGEFNQPHYILTNKSIDSSLSFLSPIPIKEYSEIPGIIDELILIKESCENNESQEIKHLKEQLQSVTKELEAYKNSDEADKDKLLEREALKYFSKGVEYHLSDQPEDAIVEYKTALELKPDYHKAFNNWGTCLGNLAKTKDGKDAEELYEQAFEKFNKAVEIKPDYHEALYNWGTDLGNLAQTKDGKDAEELYEQAFEKFNKAVEIKPDLHQALYNWGTYLGNLAKTKDGKDTEQLYKQAFEKFNKAVEIKPDKHEAFNNWGIYLGNLAKTKDGKDAEQLYKQAFEKFNKALEIKPDKHEAFNNWGIALGNLAQTKDGKDAEQLYEQAFEKFNKALEIKPDKHQALYNWGTYLGNLAQTKGGKDAEQLYEQAFEKFNKALEIKPEKHEALYNWGIYLGNLAQIKDGKDAEALYDEAIEKLRTAIKFGASSYNLSCIYALKGEKENALKYLAVTLQNNEIDASYVAKDKDWQEYFDDKDFKALLNKYN